MTGGGKKTIFFGGTADDTLKNNESLNTSEIINNSKEIKKYSSDAK